MRYIIGLIILIFGWWGMRDLFQPGLFTGHDIWHQVARFYWYHQSLSEGHWPSWVYQLANGYGYPLFIFSYHLPWMFGEFLLRLGVDLISALKWLFILGYVGSGLSMFYCSWVITKSRGASLLSAILYMWAPYHFLSVYVSASIGTVLGFWLLPLMVVGIYKLKFDQRMEGGVVLVAISVAGLILSHLITFLFVWPLMLVWVIGLSFLKEGLSLKRFWLRLVVGGLWGGLLSLFYLMPAIIYSKMTNAPSEPSFSQLYKSNLANFSQLLYSKWGYSPIVNNAKNGEISLQLGVAQWLAMVMIGFGIFKLGWRHRLAKLGLTLVVALIAMVWLMTDPSSWFWAVLVRYVTLDYPFRLLLPMVFVGSLAGALAYVMAPKWSRILILVGLVVIALYTNRNHIQVNEHTNIPVQLYIDSEVTTNSFNEYLPRGVSGFGTESAVLQPMVATVSELSIRTNRLEFMTTSTQSAAVSIKQYSFPGQTLQIDGQDQPFRTEVGLINFDLSAGEHRVLVEYRPTLLMRVSQWISLVALMGLGGLIWSWRWRK